MNKLKVLFLCTGNSARSILCEYLLRKKAPQRFASYSAGAAPKDAPHPLTLEILRANFGVDPSPARSKSWKEFADVHFDFVITVCDNARESCPIWPGQPIIAHWGAPDPAAFDGPLEAQRRLFLQVAHLMNRRLDLFLNLPLDKLDRLRVQIDKATSEIGTDEVFDESASLPEVR
ncbi:MAG: arsenate reductase ArsC [Opitutales bacterium]